ncbi:MAG: S1 RNA-binding domain-containing protein [Bacteroidota bacterium]
MEVTRLISVFDLRTERLVEEINIDHIDFELLKKIFKPPSSDPLMYNPFDITEKEIRQLKKILNIEFDTSLYHYDLDCYQKPKSEEDEKGRMSSDEIQNLWRKVMREYKVGQLVKGKVIRHENFGIFLDIGEGKIPGYVDIINISDEEFIGRSGFPPIGQKVEGVVLVLRDCKVNMSLKKSHIGGSLC